MRLWITNSDLVFLSDYTILGDNQNKSGQSLYFNEQFDFEDNIDCRSPSTRGAETYVPRCHDDRCYHVDVDQSPPM